MSIDINRLIVEDAVCADCSVHAKRVHHREFPELRAECGSVGEAVAHLLTQFQCARENAQSHWHSGLIDRAIADTARFLQLVTEAGQKQESACTCAPRLLRRGIESTTPTHDSSQ